MPGVMLMMMLYTLLVMRIQRVRGNLSSIEFYPLRPWDLRDDMLVKQWQLHPLQQHETSDQAGALHSMVNTVIILKLFTTTASKLLSSYPSVVAGTVVVTGVYLACEPVYLSRGAAWSKPYPDRTTNQGLTALGGLVFLAGATAEVLVLSPGSQMARISQSVFGIAAALIVTATVFVLTPFGAPCGRAWAKCAAGAADRQKGRSDSGATVEVANPLAAEV